MPRLTVIQGEKSQCLFPASYFPNGLIGAGKATGGKGDGLIIAIEMLMLIIDLCGSSFLEISTNGLGHVGISEKLA